MLKKIFFTFLVIYSSTAFGQQTMTIETTSISNSWAPTNIVNSGSILKWEVTGGVFIPEQTTNLPTFDLSGNTGIATITITSDDDFIGLTQVDVRGKDITFMNVDNATELTRLIAFTNNISTIDLSNNTKLEEIRFQVNDLISLDVSNAINLSTLIAFSNQLSSIDIAANASLTILNVKSNNLNSIDINSNSLLEFFSIKDNNLSSVQLDNIVNLLDGFGLSNGELEINGNSGITSAAQTGYDNLIAKSWNIDVNSPSLNNPLLATIKTISTSPTWTPSNIVNSGTILKWEVTGGISIPEQTINIPTFDLSGNTGTAAITITGNDGFNGLTQVDVRGKDITFMDVNNATELTRLIAFTNNISTIDLSNNTKLEEIRLQVNDLTSLDVSNAINLSTLIAFSNQLSSIDITFNSLLIDLSLENNILPSTALDAIVNKLDAHGLSNGTLQLANNTGTLTTASLVAYNNLIAKGWTFDVPAPAPAPGPEINVTGNGISIISGNTPIVADDTDFGQVAIGSPITHTFTIENLGDSDLTISPPLAIIIGGNYFSEIGAISPSTIPSGTTSTVSIQFNPLTVGIQNTAVYLYSNDPNESPYIINLTAEGIAASSGGTIDVQGNAISIANGDITPDVADDTDFGQVLNNTTKTTTYTIFNNHAIENLTVDAINLAFGINEFQMGTISETLPFSIVPGGSITFDVEFTPTSSVSYSSSVEITNSESGQNPFQYNIAGEGANVVISGDIMITQYYEGTSASKWIEIKNISGAILDPNDTQYYLALYDESTSTAGAPTAFEAIPLMQIDEVLLFSNVGPVLPNAGNLGTANIIATAVCNFSGDDIIIISTSNDALSYANRQDVFGDGDFYSNTSYIRGGCATESPDGNFNISNWINISPEEDVDVADVNTNIALGSQAIGITTWNGSNWSDLDPDKTRLVEIASDYLASNGSIEACSLTINSGVHLNLDGNTSNYVALIKDLTNNGTFTIGDKEALVMFDDNATIVGVINKKESSTARSNAHDVTYWASPVQGATIGTVFNGVDASRIWFFDQLETASSDPLDPTYWDTWKVASGSMARGIGYAAEGLVGSTAVHNIEFNGTPHNGPLNFDLNYWSDGDLENDNNLLGNPYPSAIDVKKFIDANGNIDGTLYFWTHNTPIDGGDSGDFSFDDYASVNLVGGVASGSAASTGGVVPDEFIGSGQGFFVTAINGGSIAFSNSMRVAEVNANDQFFKSSNNKKGSITNQKEIDRIWLNLTSDKAGFNQILIGFFDDIAVTEGVDRGYDATGIYSDNVLSFFSQIENNKYTIQGLPAFNESQKVNLGFDTNVAPRTLTISIDKVEGALKTSEIYLVDNLLNITHDLKASDYDFEQTTTGEFKNRFTLQFAGQILDVDDIVLGKNDFIVSNSFENLKISASKNVNSIKVYDLLGRMLINEKPNKQSFELKTENIKIGTILLIEASLENGATVSKKTIKY